MELIRSWRHSGFNVYVGEAIGSRDRQMLEETGFVFRVISPEGEYLGDTKWPIPDGSLSRGHFLTVRYDEETGEEFFEVYRIESNSRGFIYP